MTPCQRHTHQAGVVLVVSLLVLLIMGIIATTVARTNQLQLHMAANNEARVAGMQQALAIVDAVFARSINFSASSPVGHKNCLAESADESCDERSVTLEQAVLPPVGTVDVAVVRVVPEVGRMPVMSEATAHSAVHYRVAKFEVQVTYDGTAENRGRASVTQGVLVRLSDSARLGGGLP